MLRCEEVGAMLSLKVSTVRRMLARGELPKVKVTRRAVRIPLEAVQALMQLGFRPHLATSPAAPDKWGDSMRAGR